MPETPQNIRYAGSGKYPTSEEGRKEDNNGSYSLEESMRAAGMGGKTSS